MVQRRSSRLNPQNGWTSPESTGNSAKRKKAQVVSILLMTDALMKPYTAHPGAHLVHGTSTSSSQASGGVFTDLWMKTSFPASPVYKQLCTHRDRGCFQWQQAPTVAQPALWFGVKESVLQITPLTSSVLWPVPVPCTPETDPNTT